MKTRSSFVCRECGYETTEWFGKCPNCGKWNTLVETTRIIGKSEKEKRFVQRVVSPQNLFQIRSLKHERLSTNISEFDRVLGGGLVPGAVVLIAGDPGIGKSTLVLSVLGKIGGVYVTGEESAEQVKLRADRLKIKSKDMLVLPETNLEEILDSIEKMVEKPSDSAQGKPKAVVVDSIQTIHTETVEGSAGAVSQIRQVTQELIKFAKVTHIPIIIIGHVTKEGEIAGPKLLEHMVDVVCYFEGERYHQGRILRSFKNRFGPTDEAGIFEMTEAGLAEVTNPSKLFLEGRVKNVAGSAIGVILEGTRPLLVEIQALVVSSQLALPRRVVNGFDYNRLQVIIAILQKRLNLPLGSFDVFVNVSGGIKISEPASDLPVALSLISAVKNQPVPEKTAVFGELGLMGEIRRVPGETGRVKETKRLGLTTLITPANYTTLSQVVNDLFAK